MSIQWNAIQEPVSYTHLACVLTEFGTDLNTAQEAKLSAKYLARVIAEYLNK